MDCAKALEIPARIEQIAAAEELDRQYEEYVQECQRKFGTTNRSRSVLTCSSRSNERLSAGSIRENQQGIWYSTAVHNIDGEITEMQQSGCECVVS